jgi:small subunit ribosomal protein S2
MTTSIRQLLEARVHLGHKTAQWNPKARSFIHSAQNGSHVIDLLQTQRALDDACDFMREAASERKIIVFVGTKRQACEVVED